MRSEKWGVEITESHFQFIAEGDTITSLFTLHTPHSKLHTLNDDVCSLKFHMKRKHLPGVLGDCVQLVFQLFL